MENNIINCTGNWLVDNYSETWSYKYFFKEDFGCRYFEVLKDNKVLITSAIDGETISTISSEEFKEEFGNDRFLNVLYYKTHFKNIGFL